MSYDDDPFEDPTPHSSKNPNAYAFRGRLILVEPTGIERNVPKMNDEPNGAKGDKITANVTVLDGKGPIELHPHGDANGEMLDGPVFRKVWFTQDQIVEALQNVKGELRGRVLLRIDTLKPGTKARKGNPWVITACTPEEKKQAAAALANLIINPEPEENPFG